MFSYEQDIYKQRLPEIVHISGISNKAESEFKCTLHRLTYLIIGILHVLNFAHFN